MNDVYPWLVPALALCVGLLWGLWRGAERRAEDYRRSAEEWQDRADDATDEVLKWDGARRAAEDDGEECY